jgi:hypothetical protein
VEVEKSQSSIQFSSQRPRTTLRPICSTLCESLETQVLLLCKPGAALLTSSVGLNPLSWQPMPHSAGCSR